MRIGWRSRCKIRRLRSSGSVIRFLTAAGEKPAAIHRRMVTVYLEKCVSDKSVRKWSARFRSGRESVGDDQRPDQARQTLSSRAISSTRWTTYTEKALTPICTVRQSDACPDMLPFDFHVFGPLKKRLKGKRFNSDDVLKDTVKDLVSSWPQELWEQEILWLVHQWDCCAQAYGVYFE
ncbi:HTH_48 domain-containing protein [Trichonephila inaurata madagascariensis]|uniref:HTH_48 domain-containing protein n=1 Tax=Trichonephila inaurata madagascariensis TaxID=2747483 RepID=A0A8X6X3C4_9ARAC|nr:HTH_48 domain-containing protein [Trichonephila inaurata madagascariensis]